MNLHLSPAASSSPCALVETTLSRGRVREHTTDRVLHAYGAGCLPCQVSCVASGAQDCGGHAWAHLSSRTKNWPPANQHAHVIPSAWPKHKKNAPPVCPPPARAGGPRGVAVGSLGAKGSECLQEKAIFKATMRTTRTVDVFCILSARGARGGGAELINHDAKALVPLSVAGPHGGRHQAAIKKEACQEPKGSFDSNEQAVLFLLARMPPASVPPSCVPPPPTRAQHACYTTTWDRDQDREAHWHSAPMRMPPWLHPTPPPAVRPGSVGASPTARGSRTGPFLDVRTGRCLGTRRYGSRSAHTSR